MNLQSGWFEIHTEIPIKFHLHGYKVGEIPIQYERRGEGQSKLTIFQSVPKYLGIMITEKWKKSKQFNFNPLRQFTHSTHIYAQNQLLKII